LPWRGIKYFSVRLAWASLFHAKYGNEMTFAMFGPFSFWKLS
jgi:hypothetical protein